MEGGGSLCYCVGSILVIVFLLILNTRSNATRTSSQVIVTQNTLLLRKLFVNRRNTGLIQRQQGVFDQLRNAVAYIRSGGRAELSATKKKKLFEIELQQFLNELRNMSMHRIQLF